MTGTDGEGAGESRHLPHETAPGPDGIDVTDSMPDADGAPLGAGGLPRGVIVLLGAATGVVTVAGLRAVSDLIGPVLLALMLTIAVHPVTTALRARGAPGWLASLAGLAGVYVIVIGMGAVLAISVARLAAILPTYQDEFNDLLENVQASLAQVGVTGKQATLALEDLNLDRALDLVQQFVGALAGAPSGVVFLVTILLFMGIDASQFADRLMEVRGNRTPVAEALRGFAQGTRRYLVVSTVFGLIVAVIDVTALWWLGVPLPILWGLLSFITNYIPNIGFVIGLVPPALLGLLQGGWTLMASVIVVYYVINVVIQSIIQPKVVGDSVGLSTTMTFLSLAFWAWVLGPLGALLAVPLSLMAKGLLVDIDPSTRWLSPLLSGVPTRTPARADEGGEPEADVVDSSAQTGPAVAGT